MMKQRNRTRTVHTRYPHPSILLADPRRARLARFQDAASAEDDYFRFANRGG